MKTSRTLLFILAVFLLLGISWALFPADGIALGPKSLHFPSYAQDKQGTKDEVNVDEVREQVEKGFKMVSESLLDSLMFYREYLTFNKNRIYLPNNDYTYFDSLFYLMERAQKDHKVYRVMHYGDSQIEMDRITSVLRQHLQGMFGGSGPGMICAVKRLFSISVNQSYSGNLVRYALVSDSTSRKATHSRYGILTQFCQTSGQTTVSFSKSNNSQAYDKVKEISRVSVLFGNNSDGFKASLKAGDYQGETKTFPAKSGASMFTWELPNNVGKGSITFQGSAEIYGIMLDGGYGVAVDNDALRGCSGTIFTRINKNLMKESFKLTDTRLIILQFGGNRTPSIKSSKNISSYMRELDKQIKYFQEVAPQATLLFIGPADMSKKYNGKMESYKCMTELNYSIKAMALSNNVAYWDMFHVMGGEGSMVQYVKHKPPLGSPDHIHFTFQGAQEMGGNLAKSLIICHDFYQLRQRISNDAMIKEFMNKTPEEIQQENEARENKIEPTNYFIK